MGEHSLIVPRHAVNAQTVFQRKFRYSNFLIVAANVVKLMADYVITASGNSNLLRPSVLCLGNRGATT